MRNKDLKHNFREPRMTIPLQMRFGTEEKYTLKQKSISL